MSFSSPNLQEIAKEGYGIAGTVWHVSSTGNDSTGDGLSWGTAYATPTKAASVAVANDLILLGALFNIGSSNFSPSAGVHVRGFGPGTGITGTAANSLCEIGGTSVWTDFAIMGNAGSGVFQFPLQVNSGANAVVRRLTISGQTDCIYFYDATNAALRAYECPLFTNWDAVFVENGSGNILELHDCPIISSGPAAGFSSYFSTGIGMDGTTNSRVWVYGGAITSFGNPHLQAAVNCDSGIIRLMGTTVSTSGTAPSLLDLTQSGNGTVYVAGAKYNHARTSGTVSVLPDDLPTGTGMGEISLTAGAVTVGANEDKTGYSLTSDEISAIVSAAVATISSLNGSAPSGTPNILEGQTANPLPINYPYTQAINFSNLDATNWTEAVCTIKANPTDADIAALITVKVSNPSSGSDGLILLNGAVPVSPTTAADGMLTVTTATTTALGVTLNLTARGATIPSGNYFGEITLYKSAGKVPWLGSFAIPAVQTIRQNPIPS